jgi:integrase
LSKKWGPPHGVARADWFVFPFGKPQPTDPSKPATSFEKVWAGVKDDAGVEGRWHDNRHTFFTNLAESGEASDETIRDRAGHVSRQMMKHYSHMEAKRRAVEALVAKLKAAVSDQTSVGVATNSATVASELMKIACK